jgi:uncharacterized Fe-S radical SAM superfamily protein PflX
MDYKCNICESRLTITHSATEQCGMCGMKYNAKTKAITSGSGEAETISGTGTHMSDVQAVDTSRRS